MAGDDRSARGPSVLARILGAAGGRRALWRRRVLRKVAAAALVGVAAAVTVRGMLPPRPAPPPQVVVVLRSVAAGSVVSATDVALRGVDRSGVPPGALTSPSEVVGRRAAGPLGDGEVVTSGRLVAPGLLAGLPTGSVALQVQSDPSSTALLRAGQRVDGYLPGRAAAVLRDAVVLAVVPGPAGVLDTATTSASVILAVDDGAVADVVAGQDPASGMTSLVFAVH